MLAAMIGLLIVPGSGAVNAAPLMYQAGSIGSNNGDEVIHTFDLGLPSPIPTTTFKIGPAGSTPNAVYTGVVANTQGTVWATANDGMVRKWNASGTSQTGISIGGAYLTGLGFNEQQSWIYVADSNANGGLFRYDALTNTQLNSIPYSGGAYSPTVERQNGRVLAFTGSLSNPTFYDYSADLSHSAAITLTGGPSSFVSLLSFGAIAWAGDSGFYLADYGNGTVYRYSLSNPDGNGLFRNATLDTAFGVGGSIHVPDATWSGGVAFDGTTLYVSSYRGGSTISKYTAGGTLVQKNYLDSQSIPNGTVNQLFIVDVSPVPEIDPAGLGSVLSLLTGFLGLLERRRVKAS